MKRWFGVLVVVAACGGQDSPAAGAGGVEDTAAPGDDGESDAGAWDAGSSGAWGGPRKLPSSGSGELPGVLTCDEARSAAQALIEKWSTCESDSDCVVFGPDKRSECDCRAIVGLNRGFPMSDWRPIRKAADARDCWDELDLPGDCGGALAEAWCKDGRCDAQSTVTCNRPPPPPPCCTSDADCGGAKRCVLGSCAASPGAGSCYTDADCEPGSTCHGAVVEPCVSGQLHPATGECSPGAGPCCRGPEDCPIGDTCVAHFPGATGVCVPPPSEGRCWFDADCPAGHTCEGPALCPCSMPCDLEYEGPGVCTPPGNACTPVDPAWVLEHCDAASVVIWNGASCEPTCPGCCECKPFCDKTFATMEVCQAACLPPAGCAIWDGSCDGAIPAEPWWAYTEAGCVEVTTCACEGCAGAFPTAEACESGCVE